MTWLAGTAAARSSQLFWDVFPWLLVLLGIVVVGVIVLALARRYMKATPPSSGDGFTLQELRDLHAAGELTDAQFQRARDAMIGRLSDAEQSAPPEPPPPDDPSTNPSS